MEMRKIKSLLVTNLYIPLSPRGKEGPGMAVRGPTVTKNIYIHTALNPGLYIIETAYYPFTGT